MKKLLSVLLSITMGVALLAGCSPKQETVNTSAEKTNTEKTETVEKSKFPERPINLIVPFGAGGGTDAWNRAIAAALQENGWTVKVSNVTGGSAGSVGTMQVWNAKHDGYTFAGTSETPLVIPVMAGDKQTTDSWEYYIAGGSPGVLCVNKNANIADFQALIDATKANPGTVKIAGTSGGLWFLLASMLEYGGGIDLGVATYDGSATAITACISNETVAVAASAGEVAEFVKSGDLIPVATFQTTDFEQADFGKVPAVTTLVPEVEKYLPLNQFIGFMIPKDTPEDVKAEIQKAFLAACDSKALKEFSDQNYGVIYKWVGEEADKNCAKAQSIMSWMLYEMEKTEFNPADFNIPKP
ncbi:tripartite tricarboxylate transporter substrate binding protein [Clostridium grantii]|uniref:Tripartite-type tricarboxylate transporter, receptor component TctC n=1 Tax=Clostridium grantii DSM 8605 TaxID=1121316 RepID=A0A1M5UA27_9CLOT|nr:tripartite tricarboxylate transporter substrate binding protein [Clostridium grantii]SHH59817.1 Tripartite-type tricarboxylate transporter, receptor component TctC [Clostridium grantii DSM 8605]